MTKTISSEKLQKLNIAAGVLHLVQGIAVVLLSKNFAIPVTGNFLEFNSATQRLDPASTGLFDVQLPWLIAVFFFLSAFFHFYIATVYNKRYNADLKVGINKARWVEYSLSASVMMVAISMLVGIYDFASLLMIFGLTAIMNLLGLVMEVHNQTSKKTDWLSFNLASVCWYVAAVGLVAPFTSTRYWRTIKA